VPAFFVKRSLSSSFSNDEHTIKAGLNYRFNFGSPMVARH
jgi:outer membrane immunogenic protein